MDREKYKKRDSKVKRQRDFETRKQSKTQVKLEFSTADDSNPVDETVLSPVMLSILSEDHTLSVTKVKVNTKLSTPILKESLGAS